MAPTPLRSIFISDVHLGSSRARAERLLDFLSSCDCRYLYVVGDLVDVWERGTGDWPARHRAVLEHLGHKASNGTELFFLPGNHDRGFRRAWRDALPGSVARELEHVAADGRRFLVLHGDRFDLLERRAPWVIRLGEHFSGVAEWILGRRRPRLHASPPRLRQLLKRMLGYTGRFERRAVRRAQRRAVDGNICGHAHAPSQRIIDGIEYHNDGDWVTHCTALVEHEDGSLRLLRWPDDQPFCRSVAG